jgi:hypothetical protein
VTPYNSFTGVLLITGSAPKAVYESVLQGVRYNNTDQAPDTADRVITVTVNDGTENSNTAIATIPVTSVNDAPVISLNADDFNVRDQFGAVAYTNSNGSVAWTDDWDETSDDTNASTGDIRIVSGTLRLGDDSNSEGGNAFIERSVNLAECEPRRRRFGDTHVRL